MKLSFEQIRSVTSGAVRIEQQEDGIHFFKCTQKEQEGWYSLDKSLGDRALTTTGVRLDFHTDAGSVSFTVVSAGGNKYEILVNDVTELFTCLPAEGGEHTLSLTLPEGENRITLVLPSHSVGILKAVELQDATKCVPHVFDRRILFIGDSITQGWNAKYDSLSYAYRVSRFFNADSIIHGVGGGRFNKVTFEKLTSFAPEIITIAYGTNDFGFYQSLEAFEQAADGHLAAIAQAYPDKLRICMTPVRRVDEDQPRAIGTFAQLRQIIEKTAAKYGFHILDGYGILPYNEDFFLDAVHPNDLGFSLMANKLIAAILKAQG